MKRKHANKWVLTLGSIAAVVLALAYLSSRKHGEPVHNQRSGPSIRPPAPVNGRGGPVGHEPPTLRITSGGRLPEQIRCVRLGSSLKEAVRGCPALVSKDTFSAKYSAKLQQFYFSLGRPPNKIGDASVIFATGRLVYAEFSVANVEASDAPNVLRDTISHLGPPSFQAWEYPTTIRLVWVDGDIRIAYEDDRPGYNISHALTLTLVDWPAYSGRMRAMTAHDPSWAALLKARWEGEAPRAAPLPPPFPGVEFGATPWQTWQVLGGPNGWVHSQTQSVCDPLEQGWVKRASAHETLNACFFRRRLTSFNEDEYDTTSLEKVSDLWLATFGTPISGGPGTLTWTDGTTEVNCVAQHPSDSPSGVFEQSCGWTDVRLDAQREEAFQQQTRAQDQQYGLPPPKPRGELFGSFF